ncbi:MAG TPA: A/G-specific adenine glycosylase [Planctomycetota bacterium]|nr:A/G-specific adenine glycosylase [Planctomycetota bacterium]
MKQRRENFPWLRPLAAWFSRAKRPMPWRGTRDPYRVWISEIMLQQTQVATVIPYYERFLAKFPSVAALAAAPLDEVLKLWAGLGYYSRARNLHRGARVIIERFGGELPAAPETIREIPGIGDYTAGAILSMAFNLPEALVDGNVARVLSRVLLLDGDWRGGAGKRAVWSAARELVAGAARAGLHPGDFNEALMELGATVCSPRAPECGQCPIRTHCAARKKGVQSDYPQLKERGESPEWHLRAWIVRGTKGRILFAQRGAEGLFGGMWELPTERVDSTRIPLTPRAGTRVGPLPEGEGNGRASCAPIAFARVTQVLSHRVLKIDASEIGLADWRKRLPNDREFVCWSGVYSKFKWLNPREAQRGALALPAAQSKILALCAEKTGLFD